MKKLSIGTTLIVLSMAFLPVSAWSAPSQRLYAWGEPWSNKMSFSQYFGATPVSDVPGKVVQISTSNAALVRADLNRGSMGLGSR